MDNTNIKVNLGYAEMDITPQKTIELAGFFRPDNMSKGILHNLIAQISVWNFCNQKICMVTIDSIGFTISDSNKLRDLIAEKLGICREKVMICFSHTHSAPNVSNEKDYYDFVFNQVLIGVGRAASSFVPVKAVWDVVEADIGVNRRSEEGRLDRRISILKVVDGNSNQLKLLLLRVTAHANVLTSDNYLVSSDYFATTRALLEKQYQCKVMLTQGASGNVKAKYRQTNADFWEIHFHEASMMKEDADTIKKHFDESIESLDKMAIAIRDAINSSVENSVPQPIYKMGMVSEIIPFSADVPTIERANEIADEAMQECHIDGTDWLNEVKRLHENKIRQQFADIEIQYFTVNNGCWCGIANEAMCEIALDISQKADDKFLHFSGYTNGCNGYLPTAEEFKKGGYEVLWSYLQYYGYYGRVMPLNEDTADKITEIVSKRWKAYK